jgi:corrinoid protein of di/trimethylamine methyltransferase
MNDKNEILQKLARAVVDMDEAGAAAAAQEAIAEGLDAYVAITEGLAAGMREVGELYERGEYYVPEILVCSDAMNGAIEILKPHIKNLPDRKPVKVLLGVIEGDIHDLGKNIVKIMLDAAGFEVIDLGRDVKAERFIEAAREAKAGIIGLSTLMSTTMGNMKKVVDALIAQGLREDFKVIVGGGPTSPEFAESIGADGHGHNAKEAVDLAEKFAGRLSCLKN